MHRCRAVIGLSLLCALLVGAIFAQSASAKGETVFTCAPATEGAGFSDAHCDKAVASGAKFKHVEIPVGKSVGITYTNEKTASETTASTTKVLKVPKLHGFANLVIECKKVSGTATMENIAGPPMTAKGSSILNLTECTTNQVGCTAKIASISATAEPVETAATESMEAGMGIKLAPTSSNFTTVTFVGTCGLSAFGAIPVSGSLTGTANGEPNGKGATVVFSSTVGQNVTVGGEKATVEGKYTGKGENGNALVATTEA